MLNVHDSSVLLQKNKGKSESSLSQYDLKVKMKVLDRIIYIHDMQNI